MGHDGFKSHSSSGTGRASSNAGLSGGTPGKRTLTEALPTAPVQRKRGGGETEEAARPAPRPSGAGTALPQPVQAKMERSFGADFSSVRVHEGAHVHDMGASAYTQGTDIHFAPGEYRPDSQSGQELIGHELSHVVQQSQGRVSATQQFKGGIAINDDAALEQEADDMGARAARGEQVGGTAAGTPLNVGAGAVQRKVIQKKDVATHFGTFKTTKFSKIGTKGVDCVLEFHPDGNKIDAKKIGLSQSIIRTHDDGTHTALDPTKEGRRVKSGIGTDHVLDRLSDRNTPIYGSNDLGATEGLDKTKKDNNTSSDPTKVGPDADGGNATYQLGFAFTEGSTKKTKPAALYDGPVGGGKFFETTALGLEGADQNKYFGSVKWGYKMKASGSDVDLSDIEIASMGVPTQKFLEAAELWNTSKTRGTLEVIADPAKAKKTSDMSAVDVAKGTKVTQKNEVRIGGKPMVEVAEVADATKTYYILVVDLKDVGDGGKTVDVPVPVVFANAAATPLFSDSEMKTKVKDLPANTRMQNTSTTAHGSKGMKIVDGADIGTAGFVDATKVQQEK